MGSEEIGLHPTAVARTSEEARQGRTAQDWEAARDPVRFRAGWAEILASPPSSDRTAVIEQAYRAAYTAFERRDWELNTLTMHPTEYTFKANHPRNVIPDLPGGEYPGVEGYLEAMDAWVGPWSEMSVELEEILEGDHGARFVPLFRFRLRGAGSGLLIDQAVADVHTLRDGWLIRQEYGWDRAATLRSAGLESPPR